jgi:hypothetical protein
LSPKNSSNVSDKTVTLFSTLVVIVILALVVQY